MDTHFVPHAPSKRIEQRSVGHCFDFLASAVGLVLLLPLLVVIALSIKLSDGGRVLYRQRRIGRGFQPFFVYKFRTMIPGADRLGAGITAAQDPRVTPLGRILRRYKLDELPQLWNVLRGEMALVGPRPEVPEFVESFRAMYGPLLSVRPGITDPGTLAFSNEEELLSGAHSLEIYAEEILPKKLSLSLEYCEGRTWKSDMGVVFRTLARVLIPRRPKTAVVGRSLLAGEVVTPFGRRLQ
jgi:lipopolysaccharide/colanic/teichoic acid biosynthesis glycosyltransferase